MTAQRRQPSVAASPAPHTVKSCSCRFQPLIVPPLRRPGPLALAAVGYGLALWILHFQILGRTVFPFLTNPNGPNQLFEGLVHPLIFGLALVPFFLGWPPRAIPADIWSPDAEAASLGR
jgi:hypothetical protein